MSEHESVLAPELVSLLAPEPGQVAVDCTFGGGGHARLVAELIGPEGTLIGIDRDPAAQERFNRFAAEAPCRTLFISSDFAAGLRALQGEGIRPDMVYVDLGMSSMQVDARERGFSYSYDAPLDMRMDPSQELDARTVVNDWDERQLAQVLRRLGEEPNARRIAREIVRRRRKSAIVTTGELVEVNEWPESRIAQVLRRFGEERHAGGIAREIVARRPLATTGELVAAIKAGMPASARFGAGHPAKRSFQAIRIAVNGELEALIEALPLAWSQLKLGGRLAAISFHSLEDRPVKQFLAAKARGCVCPPELPVCVCGHEPEAELLTRRAISPGPGEAESNPRSRSAHLRAAVKITAEQPAGETG